MIEVLGIDGRVPEANQVRWGAALVRCDGVLRNSLSWVSVTESEANELSHYDCIGRLDAPWSLNAISDRRIKGSVLLFIGMAVPHYDYLKKIAWKQAIVDFTKRQNLTLVIFESLAAFNEYADSIAQYIFSIFMNQSSPTEEEITLLEIGVELSQRNPHLLACKSFVDRENLNKRIILRRLCNTEELIASFDSVWNALERRQFLYKVKYRDGIAKRGGLDISHMSMLCSSFASIQRIIEREQRREYYGKLPTAVCSGLQLNSMSPNSATFEFTSSLDDDTPLMRYMRQKSIRKLKSLMNGVIPDNLRTNAKFMRQLERVASPDEETVVLHQWDEQDEYSEVLHKKSNKSEFKPVREISCLGFIEGVFHKLQKIELRVGRNLTIEVSAVDNGDGEFPDNISVTKERNDILFRPMRIRMIPMRNAEGELRVYLRGLHLIDAVSCRIKHIQSQVKCSHFLKAEFDVCQRGDTLIVGPELYSQTTEVSIKGNSLSAAEEWIDALCNACGEFELDKAAVENSQWFQCGATERLSALDKCVMALNKLGGKGNYTQVVKSLREDRIAPPSLAVIKKFISQDECVQYGNQADMLVLTDRGTRYGIVLEKIFRAGGVMSTPESDDID